MSHLKYLVIAIGVTLVSTSPASAQTPVQVSQSDVYTLRWALPADPGIHELSKDQRSRPTLSPDAQFVFRAYSNGRIEKRRVSDGEVLWTRDLNIEVQSALAYLSSFEGQDWISVVDALGTLHALSAADGTTLKEVKVGGASSCEPVVTAHGLLLVAGDDRLVMLDPTLAKTEPKWSTERVSSRGMTMLGAGCPALAESLVCHGRSDGAVSCYDLKTGTLSWSRRLASTQSRLAVHDADAGPVYHQGAIYAASISGGVYRLSASTGEIEWQLDLKNIHRLGANRFGLFALSMDGMLIGLDEKGEKRFETTLPSKRLETLLVGKTLVLISAGETGLVLIEGERGKPIQARALAGEALSLPSTAGRHLVVQDASGFLYHFELSGMGS